jgi:hypothetical protein
MTEMPKLGTPKGRLKKIAISGGTPIVIADAPGLKSFSWGSDNAIVYGQLNNGCD